MIAGGTYCSYDYYDPFVLTYARAERSMIEIMREYWEWFYMTIISVPIFGGHACPGKGRCDKEKDYG